MSCVGGGRRQLSAVAGVVVVQRRVVGRVVGGDARHGHAVQPARTTLTSNERHQHRHDDDHDDQRHHSDDDDENHVERSHVMQAPAQVIVQRVADPHLHQLANLKTNYTQSTTDRVAILDNP